LSSVDIRVNEAEETDNRGKHKKRNQEKHHKLHITQYRTKYTGIPANVKRFRAGSGEDFLWTFAEAPQRIVRVLVQSPCRFR
jgi:hypothetical protein